MLDTPNYPGIAPALGARGRAYALDALRGLAILGMILSGQLPFGEKSLPAWMYRLYYLQYLFIVVPGTIAGDLLREWMEQKEAERAPVPGRPNAWSPLRFLAIGLLMLGLTVLLVVGLKARWLVATTLTTFALCAAG